MNTLDCKDEKHALGVAQCGCVVTQSVLRLFECLEFLPFWLLLSITLKGAGSPLKVGLGPCKKVSLNFLCFEINTYIHTYIQESPPPYTTPKRREKLLDYSLFTTNS